MIMCKEKVIILSVADCIRAKPVDDIKGNGSLVMYSGGVGEQCLKERMGDTNKIFVYRITQKK